jgi:hypothetical protein
MPKKKAKEKKTRITHKHDDGKVASEKIFLNLLDQLKESIELASKKAALLLKRIEVIEQNNINTSNIIKTLEIGARQMLGRHQLHSLKFEGVRGIGNTVDKLGERVDECEAKLMIMEVNKKDRK